MAFLTPDDYETRDIYLYWDYEETFSRYDHREKKHYILTLGGPPEAERSFDTKIVCDMGIFGVEISKEDYYAQKVPPSDEN
jgi:hypothetical protein